MQADCLPDRVGLAVRVGELNVEVADFPEAVAAKLERVGHDADPVLADVKSVAPALERPRVGVRDEQFCHRGTPDDRPDPALVLVSDGMQDEALAGGEAQAEPPALPADLPAADLEARASGLNDPQRLEIVSQGPDAVGGIGTRTGRQRHDAQVLHPQLPSCRRGPRWHAGRGSAWRTGCRPAARGRTAASTDPASRILSGREHADPPRLHEHLRGTVMPRRSSPAGSAGQPWSPARTRRIPPASPGRAHREPTARTRPTGSERHHRLVVRAAAVPADDECLPRTASASAADGLASAPSAGPARATWSLGGSFRVTETNRASGVTGRSRRRISPPA